MQFESNQAPARVLIVTAVEAERAAIASGLRHRAAQQTEIDIIVCGVGRVNAACATTQALLERGPFDLVISAGVAGSLSAVVAIGDVIVASACIYAEEGLRTPDGFCDMSGLGFPLGDFEGNAVPVDAATLSRLQGGFMSGRIATVATCSGTNAASAEIAQRTEAIAESMEGAAVVHAARRLGVPAIEIRAISNTTGDRDRQQWNLPFALQRLGEAMSRVV